MLVLTRKERESIRIGNNVVIHVKRIDGNRIRIGIEAPQDTTIRRGELPAETMTDQPGSAERNGTMPEGERDDDAG